MTTSSDSNPFQAGALISLQNYHHSWYLSVTHGQTARGEEKCLADEEWMVEMHPGGKISLKNGHQPYWLSMDKHNVSGAPHCKEWEKFTPYPVDGGIKWALVGHRGTYLSMTKGHSIKGEDLMSFDELWIVKKRN